MRAARAALTAVSVAVLVAVPACEEEDVCRVVGEPSTTAVAHTAILLDVSASTRSSGRAPDWAAAVDAAIVATVDRGDVVSIGTFDGSAATVNWTVRDRATAPTSERTNNQEAERKDTKSCLRRLTREAARTTARTDGTDVLGALGAAAEQTRGAGDGRRRTVVIATDGLSTAGCADLSGTPVGNSRLIDVSARECPSRPDWPAALAGTHLRMLGVGHPAEGQPVPETGHVAWLRQYWERLCLAVPAASCEISTAAVPLSSDGTAPTGGTATPPADPVVRFTPGAGPPDPGPGTVTYTVPSATLFATNSDVVGPDGVSYLTEVKEQVGDRISRIEVVGHTDSRSDRTFNQALSERRAAAVGAVLQGLGLPVSATGGKGEDARICPSERRSDGSWDEDCLQRNRRVEIVITRESE